MRHTVPVQMRKIISKTQLVVDFSIFEKNSPALSSRYTLRVAKDPCEATVSSAAVHDAEVLADRKHLLSGTEYRSYAFPLSEALSAYEIRLDRHSVFRSRRRTSIFKEKGPIHL